MLGGFLNKEELLKTYGSMSAAARALGIHRSTLERRLELYGSSLKPTTSLQPQQIFPTAGKNLEHFRAKFDKNYAVPLKIQEALTKLGPENWEYESGMAKLAGCGVAEISRFRDKFAEYVVEVHREGKKVWAGSPALAEKMRNLLA